MPVKPPFTLLPVIPADCAGPVEMDRWTATTALVPPLDAPSPARS